MAVANFFYKTEPRQHQVDGFYKLYGLPAFAELMEQGTGKTKLAIDIACNLFLEKKIEAVMVIAPNNVHSQWADEEIPKHASVPYNGYVWDNKHTIAAEKELRAFLTKKIDGELKWFCVNVEAFSYRTNLDIYRDYVKRYATFVIVDEATKIKNPDAERTQNIIQGLSDVQKAGKRIVSLRPYSKYRAILTGTVVTNAPFNAWAPFEFLQTNFFGLDYFSFKARYGIEVRMRLPGKTYDIHRKITTDEIKSVRRYAEMGKSPEDISRLLKISESSARFLINNPRVNAPYKNLDELKRKIDTISFCVLKKDCYDLPPKIYERVVVDLSAEQRRVYKELVSDYFAIYNDTQMNPVNKVTLIGRLQQITGGFFPGETEDGDKITTPFSPNPKLEALVDDLEECNDRPVIIIAKYVNEINAIEARLKKEYPEETTRTIYGKVRVEERNAIREAFNRGEISFLVANAATIGMGFNLQICHTMYFYSNDFSFDLRAQVEDRIHRDGQKADTVLYKDIVVKGSIDEKVLSVLKMKKDLLDYMRDKTVGEFLG